MFPAILFVVQSSLSQQHTKEILEMTVAEKTNIIPSGTYALDPLHSSATFAVRHAAATFRGGFKGLDGRLEASDGEAKLTGTAKVESIDVEDENLRPHLLSPEFFDIERTPEVKFASTSIEAEGEELVVRGELEIAGITHEVSARGHVTGPITGPDGKGRIGLELHSEVDRTDYGFDWNMELPDGGTILGNEVEIAVNLELAEEDE
jgi:polyisoprenoid-binding protein YceI